MNEKQWSTQGLLLGWNFGTLNMCVRISLHSFRCGTCEKFCG